MISVRHILVATDFGDASAAALAYGRRLAHAFGADLRVINVVDDLLSRSAALGGYVTDLGQPRENLEDTMGREIQRLFSEEDRLALRAKAIVRVSDSPANTIVEYAQEASIDLIVVGTHGRGVIGHVLMGSVAERVVRTAPCPVLTVRNLQPDFVHADVLAEASRAQQTSAGACCGECAGDTCERSVRHGLRS